MSFSFKYSRKDIIGAISVACILTILLLVLKSSRTGDLGPPKHEYTSSLISNTEVDSLVESPEKFDFFDPNDLIESEWVDLGFSEKQANSIVKYHSNYGPFKNASDVEKIYVISDEKFAELKPYMVFNEDVQAAEINTIEDKKYDFKLLEINVNSATSEELQEISGIGEVYAERIIKFRNLLGGFVSKTQFEEVYGLSPESKLALEENTVIDKSIVQKINVNSASKSEIRKHPYFKKWEVVTAILVQREKSELSNLDFLLDQNLVNREELEKMIPYASF